MTTKAQRWNLSLASLIHSSLPLFIFLPSYNYLQVLSHIFQVVSFYTNFSNKNCQGMLHAPPILPSSIKSSFITFSESSYFFRRISRRGVHSLHPTPKMEDRRSPAVHDCLLNTLAVMFRVWGPSPLYKREISKVTYVIMVWQERSRCLLAWGEPLCNITKQLPFISFWCLGTNLVYAWHYSYSSMVPQPIYYRQQFSTSNKTRNYLHNLHLTSSLYWASLTNCPLQTDVLPFSSVLLLHGTGLGFTGRYDYTPKWEDNFKSCFTARRCYYFVTLSIKASINRVRLLSVITYTSTDMFRRLSAICREFTPYIQVTQFDIKFLKYKLTHYIYIHIYILLCVFISSCNLLFCPTQKTFYGTVIHVIILIR
jgi:hypothetical protein